MAEFKKNPIAIDEVYFKLSDHIYDNSYLHKEVKIKESHNKKWIVIETIDADKEKIKNGLQAIAVVLQKNINQLKNIMKISFIHSVEQNLGNLMEIYLQTPFSWNEKT